MSRIINKINKNILSKDSLHNIHHAIKCTYALYAAHELKLFKLINERRTLSFKEICEELGIQPRSAQALLSLCMSLNLIGYNKKEKYFLTKIAQYYLVPESPFYWGNLLDVVLQNPSVLLYDSFKEALLSSNSQIYNGKDFFETNEQDEELTKSFTLAMHSKSKASAIFWPKVLDLSNYRCLLDIGGGSGAHSISAVNVWPNLKAIIYERPLVADIACSFIKEENLEEKISIFNGNMWEDKFPVADLHFYCDVFHNWDYDQCYFLAQKSFDALPENGRIILHELVFKHGKKGPLSAAFSNASMLLWTQGGQQYSQGEFNEILSNVGFKNIQLSKTGFGEWSIITGTKK